MFSPKIVHITSVHSPYDIRIFQKECRTLARAGFDVVLVAPSDRDEKREGVRICGVPKPRSRFKRMLLTGRAIARAAREDAALYHIHDPELLLGAKWLQWLGKPVIYDMHENVPKALLSKPWIPAALRPGASRLFHQLERFLLKGMNVIMAETSYRDSYPWLPDQEVILNMPILSSLAATKENKHPLPTLGYLGAVCKERGSLATLEALRQLKDEGLAAGWECVGFMYERHQAELETFIQQYGLDHVRLHGFLPPQEGWRLMAKCHVGLAVLEATPNSIESYPTKLFEYMAMGIPVITSHFPLYRSIVDTHRCGICVDPDDPRAIADAIRWLIEHPGEAEAMGERGRKATLACYSWDSEAEKLIALYRGLVPIAPTQVRLTG